MVASSSHSHVETLSLTEIETYSLITEYGIPVVQHVLAQSPKEAAQAGESLGWPVVCKIVSPDIIHKSSIGGVIIGLTSRKEVISAFNTIMANVTRNAPQAKITGCLIAKQAPPGLAEVIVGGLRDIEFGSSVMCGAGGEFAEILKCVTFRPAPTNQQIARQMVENTRKKLINHHGWKSLDPEPLADAIVKMGDLIVNNPQIDSIDLNPLIAYLGSCLVVDSKAVKSG